MSDWSQAAITAAELLDTLERDYDGREIEVAVAEASKPTINEVARRAAAYVQRLPSRASASRRPHFRRAHADHRRRA